MYDLFVDLDAGQCDDRRIYGIEQGYRRPSNDFVSTHGDNCQPEQQRTSDDQAATSCHESGSQTNSLERQRHTELGLVSLSTSNECSRCP